MRTIFKVILAIIVFIIIYYGVYVIGFSVKIGDKLLIKYLQKELVLDKDIAGKTLNEFDKNKIYNIVFLGSSHCYRSFGPKFFELNGITAYNLGTSSQTPLISYAIAQQIIKNTQHLVFEIYPIVASITGAESYYSLIASTTNDAKLCANIAISLNTCRAYNILSIKPLIDYSQKNTPYKTTFFYKGYVATFDTVKGIIPTEHIILDDKIYNIQLNYINKLVELCKKNKVKISFVYAPVSSKLSIEGEANFMTKLNSIVRHNAIPFYNYGHTTIVNDTLHFYDNDHMNAAGVKLLNDTLIKLGLK